MLCKSIENIFHFHCGEEDAELIQLEKKREITFPFTSGRLAVTNSIEKSTAMEKSPNTETTTS